MNKYLTATFVLVLVGFGLLTLFLSTAVIFDLFGIRAKEGNYVLFVVWANFVSSIIYLAAAIGMVMGKTWVTRVLLVAGVILAAALVGLFFYVNAGGIYETKTPQAMIFRTVFTLFLAGSAYLIHIKKDKK